MKRRLSLKWKITIIVACEIAGVLAGFATSKLEPASLGVLFTLLCWGVAYIGAQAGKEARPS